MARLIGVDLPRDKRVEIGLTYIFGVGRTRALQAVEACGIDRSTRVKDLNDEQLVALRDFLEGNFQLEGDLRREVAADIRRKVEIGSYQGIRHRRRMLHRKGHRPQHRDVLDPRQPKAEIATTGLRRAGLQQLQHRPQGQQGILIRQGLGLNPVTTQQRPRVMTEGTHQRFVAAQTACAHHMAHVSQGLIFVSSSQVSVDRNGADCETVPNTKPQPRSGGPDSRSAT